MEPWIEGICDPQRPCGLGCNVCRLAGMDSAYARGEIRGKNKLNFTDLRRHGGAVGTPRGQLPAHPHGQLPAHCRAHMCAQEKFRQLVEEEELGRRDVPNRGLCMTAHKFQPLEGV